MKIIESIEQMKKVSQDFRTQGKKISFVPTMGYLHQGHRSLLKKGREVGDRLITSIFVNPIQFGQGEDFEKYPRDMEKDRELCEAEGVDILFTPKTEEMYPDEYQTSVEVLWVTKNLCGRARPGHFRGVATVVTKLFNIIRPHYAVFGEKDFQQLVAIRRLVKDLDMDMDILGMPIMREPDGLAMSSRNAYLSTEERKAALSIYKALQAAKGLYDKGERTDRVLLKEVKRILEAEPMVKPEYAKVVDINTMEDIDSAGKEALLAIAAWVGNTRLIDNVVLRKM